jgi:hypothetical protein
MMRSETIAVAALLISPLPTAQGQQSSIPARIENRVERPLYHQVVRDDGIGLGLVTEPGDVDFRPYFTAILATLKNNGYQSWLGWSRDLRPVVIEAVILHDGSIARLGFIPPPIRSPDGVLTTKSFPYDAGAYKAAINSVRPFLALPDEFKGDRIIVHFEFRPVAPRL